MFCMDVLRRSSSIIQSVRRLWQQPISSLHSTNFLGIKASELTKENLPDKEGCPICSRGITFRMTDVLFLSQFLTPEGRMINRRKTGVCKKQQQRIFKYIHIARRIGLLPRIVPKDGEEFQHYGQKSRSQFKKTYPSNFP